MNKLVVCIMGQNCERFIGMCLESVKDADSIVYLDGGSTDNTLHIVNKFENINRIAPTAISNKYDQEDKAMNGKQRNFYLKYLKENYPDWWALCLDADEVVEDLGKIKEFIQNPQLPSLYSVKMRHLIQDLTHEDAMQQEHFVLNRLFKISETGNYPEVEHPVLEPKYTEGIKPYTSNMMCFKHPKKELFALVGKTDCTTIWHLAYIPNLWEIKKRYENHLKKSNMHTPEFLKGWYKAHLFGRYPVKQFNPVELPKVILDNFGIDKDELYFENRGLEVKHFIDAIHWKEFFKCKTAIEFGCGRGPRVYALNHIGIECYGHDISKFAVITKLHRNVYKNDILDYGINSKVANMDLIIAYDLLEHISYKDIDKVIDNLISHTTKNLLISVPFKGTPNCDADPTHIIKEDKIWWIEKFTNKGLKLIPTPDHFLFKEQILIFEKELK